MTSNAHTFENIISGQCRHSVRSLFFMPSPHVVSPFSPPLIPYTYTHSSLTCHHTPWLSFTFLCTMFPFLHILIERYLSSIWKGQREKNIPNCTTRLCLLQSSKNQTWNPAWELNIHFWERRVLLEHSSRSLCPYPEIRVDTLILTWAFPQNKTEDDLQKHSGFASIQLADTFLLRANGVSMHEIWENCWQALLTQCVKHSPSLKGWPNNPEVQLTFSLNCCHLVSW